MKEFQEEVKKSAAVMKNKGIILYPTDTIWGIGCDATCGETVKKIFKIKKRNAEKNFILLLDHESRLSTYVKEVPEQAWALIEYAERPLTIIYNGAKNLPPELIAEDGSIAIRITRDDFCKNLIGTLRKPIVSTSANISGEQTPSSFHEIHEQIISSMDYVVNWRQDEIILARPSTIVSLGTDGQIKFIRR